MRFIPDLSFNGNCNEALPYYKNIFNGEIIQIVTYEDAVIECNEEFFNKIFSAVMVIGKNTLYFSDEIRNNQQVSTAKVSIMIEFFNEEEMRECFLALSKDGIVIEDIKETNWGSLYGTIEDKYGFYWNFNFELSIL